MNRINANASSAPIACMSTNIGAEAGAIPANESDSVLAIVTAGFAKLVDDVNQ